MKSKPIVLAARLALAAFMPLVSHASSHMDAPLVTLDPSANTTDVYAFVSERNGVKLLIAALAVYPFEEPGIGPNKHNFDDNVLYQIHVATGDNVAAGKATMSYEFRFNTTFKNEDIFAPSFLGVIDEVDDDNQNLTQTYTVTKVMAKGRPKREVIISNGIVPPNNQGLVTPFYNQGNDGNNRAKEGVATLAELDKYTAAGIISGVRDYRSFAGQRDDGFYADVQSVFDLDPTFSGPNKPFDSQGGFNVHTMVLSIPLSELGGDRQTVGVWATTSRPRVRALRSSKDPRNTGDFVQVGRQGNPLFCEIFIGQKDKDKYNRQGPDRDAKDFSGYALEPQLGGILIDAFGLPEDRKTNRTDIAGIFIPDVIKVDLSTPKARFAGGENAGSVPDDAGFNRLSVFGDDTLPSALTGGQVPGGWPNGRRFGDDVVDIGVIALVSDLRPNSTSIVELLDVDKVTGNDIGYNKVFPYAATPLNGRNHGHH
jgi:hypothetical protein